MLAVCAECRHHVSDHATACPKCGMSIKQIIRCDSCWKAERFRSDCMFCDGLGYSASPAPVVKEWGPWEPKHSRNAAILAVCECSTRTEDHYFQPKITW